MQVARIVVVAGTALALLSAGAARVALRAAPRQADIALSPEEAVIAIKPLQLAAGDVPQDYALGPITVDTPVSDAVRQAAGGADPYAALGSLAAEGTQACSVQGLTPPAASPLATAQLAICVMTDPVSAQNDVTGAARAIDPAGGTLTQELAPPDLTLGDGTPGLWRLVQMDSNGRSGTSFELRWSRGLVAFELRARARAGKEDPGGTEDLGRSIDGGEATRAPAALGAPTVAPPVTEAQRLYATLSAQTALVPVSQPPLSTSRLYMNTIQLPAEAVLNANNPIATLHLLDEQFRRAVYVNRVYRATDRQLVHGQRLTVDADTVGAAAELANRDRDGYFQHVDTNDQPIACDTLTDTELTPPLQLGDGTRAFRTLCSYADVRNNFVTFTMRWTHGPVVLQARIGSFQSRDQQLADLIPWVQQVEQQYQASALPAASSDLAALPLAAGTRITHIQLTAISPIALALPSANERPRRSARKARAAALPAA